MPLIKPDKAEKNLKVKFIINDKLHDEIKEYCKWAKIEDGTLGMFFEQAAEFVLKKDQDWKKFKKSNK